MSLTGLRERRSIPVYRGNNDTMKLSFLAEQYDRFMGTRLGYSPRTMENYGTAYGQFIAYVIEKGAADDLRSFTDDNVEGFCQYLADRGVSANTIGSRMSALASLGRYLTMTKLPGRDVKYLPANPVLAVQRPQRTRVSRPYLRQDELGPMLALDAPVYEALARDIIMETGLRVSEVARLDIGDVEEYVPPGETETRVRVWTVVKGKGRRSERVQVSLPRALGERVLESIATRGGARQTDPLLLNRIQNRYTRTALSNMIARMGVRAGVSRVNVRPHIMRHTMNVIAESEALTEDGYRGLSITTRARLLNHSDTSTLAKYDHQLPGRDRAARDAVRAGIDRYIGAPASVPAASPAA
jgi:integrase